MKKSVLKNPLAVGLAFIALSFTSCDLFEKASDISFNSTLDDSFVVSEPQEGGSKAYEKVITLDAAADDPEVNKYKNKIKQVTINKITYSVSNYVGAGEIILSDAKLSFSESSSTTAEVLAEIGDLNLKAASDAGTVDDLTMDATSVAKIEGYLKSDKAVNIYLTGMLSQTPVAFNIKVVLDVKVKANAL